MALPRAQTSKRALWAKGQDLGHSRPIAGETAARQSAGPAVVRKAALHADPAAA